MQDSEIDKILKQAAQASPPAEPDLATRISGTIASDLHAIQPMPSSGFLLAEVIAVCSLVGILGALVLGPDGLQRMSAVQAAITLFVLAVTIVSAARVSVAESIPGSRRILSPTMLVTVCCVVLISAFLLLFRDFRVERFIAQGIPCLRAGVLHAIAAAVLVWWVLRRGYEVNPLESALAKGTSASLAGVLMLEIHCANFETLHVVVWHTLVIPISVAFASGTIFLVSKPR